MKIGLLTVPFNNNFGGFLQAFALKTVLTNLGHEVIIINRRRNKKANIKSLIKALMIFVGVKKNYDKVLSVNTNRFIKKYLTPGTPYYFSSRALRKCLKYKFDFFIVGSDQVWRFQYAQDSIDDFFFNFLKDTNIPRTSYAASFGIDYLDYPEDKVVQCSELLKQFTKISVRENSGIYVVEKLGIKKENVTVVLDPTLLLTKNFYFQELIKNRFEEKTQGKYVFQYILDATSQKSLVTATIAQSIGCGLIKMNAQTGDLKQLEPIAPVEEWLSRIYYSDFVVTDSFHGTVFSILFNKPFVVVGNSSRGLTRFNSLLKEFGLENRMILSFDEFDNSLLNSPIEWEKVNNKLVILRNQSISYIQESLSINEYENCGFQQYGANNE